MAKAKGAATGQEVAVTGDQPLPAFLAGYTGATGQEDIDRSDVTIPRIKIGQAMSEEVKELKIVNEGDLFLNVDGSVLAAAGKELEVIIVARSTEYILWRDRQDGGGIFARAQRVKVGDTFRHRWNKPNQEFENKIKGLVKVTWKTGDYVEQDGLGEWGSENPDDPDSGIAATKHHNYVVYLPKLDMIAAMSLSRTASKVAKNLNAVLMMGKLPIFARVFKVRTVDENKGKDSWKQFKFVSAGHVTSEAVFERSKALFDQFAAEGFVVDQSDEDGGPEAAVDEGKL